MTGMICHLCLNEIKSEYQSVTDSKTFKERLTFSLPMIENIADDCVLCTHCETTLNLACDFKQEYLRFQSTLGIDNEDNFGTYGIFDYINRVMRGESETPVETNPPTDDNVTVEVVEDEANVTSHINQSADAGGTVKHESEAIVDTVQKLDVSKLVQEVEKPQVSKPKKKKRTGYTTIKDQQGEKIFSCNFCRYGTISKIRIKVHVKQHVGETVYSCKFCKYITQNSDHYKEHTRLHFGANCYVCNLCHFTTTKKDYIDFHMKTHSK